MLSIRLDSIDLTRIVRMDWSLWPRFKNEEGSCVFISRILTSGGLCTVCWKCCRFDSIRSNRHESLPLLSICHAGSRFARDTTPYESSRVVKCLLRRIDSVWVYCIEKKTGTNNDHEDKSEKYQKYHVINIDCTYFFLKFIYPSFLHFLRDFNKYSQKTNIRRRPIWQ